MHWEIPARLFLFYTCLMDESLSPHLVSPHQSLKSGSLQLPSQALADTSLRALLGRYGDRTSSFLTSYPGFLGFQVRLQNGEMGEVRYWQQRKTFFAAGEPLAPESERAGVLSRFFEEARLQGRLGVQAAAFPVGQTLALEMERRGYFAFQVGAEPVFELRKLFIGGLSPLDLVSSAKIWQRKGLRVEWLTKFEKTRSPTLQAELQACTQEWKAQFRMRELGFLSQARPLERLEEKQVFLIRYRTKIVAFISAVPLPSSEGRKLYFADVVRGEGCRHGMVEFLILEAMRLCSENDVTEIRLGMCPLAQLNHRPSIFRKVELGVKQDKFKVGVSVTGFRRHMVRGFLKQLGHWVFSTQSGFYHFKGLYEFREKLGPTRWDPLYAVFPEVSVVCVLRGFWKLFSPFSKPGGEGRGGASGGPREGLGILSESARSAFLSLLQPQVRTRLEAVRSQTQVSSIRWVWRFTFLFCFLHFLKLSGLGEGLFQSSAYIPGEVLEGGRKLGRLLWGAGPSWSGGVANFSPGVPATGSVTVSILDSATGLFAESETFRTFLDLTRRHLLSPLFHTTGFHFVGNLLSLWFFGGLLEWLLGAGVLIRVLSAGLLLSNPLTLLIVVGLLGQASSFFAVLANGLDPYQRFLVEWDYGSSNGVYACVGGLAACLKKPRIVLGPFVFFGLFLCFALVSWLSLHHLIGLGLGYFWVRRSLWSTVLAAPQGSVPGVK